MANISAEIAAFKNAAYGEDVRSALVSLAEKLNNVIGDSIDYLKYDGVLSRNSDLNDISVSRIYILWANYSYLNLPDSYNSTKQGLVVTIGPDTSTSMRFQYILANDLLFIRTRNNNQTWNAWVCNFDNVGKYLWYQRTGQWATDSSLTYDLDDAPVNTTVYLPTPSTRTYEHYFPYSGNRWAFLSTIEYPGSIKYQIAMTFVNNTGNPGNIYYRSWSASGWTSWTGVGGIGYLDTSDGTLASLPAGSIYYKGTSTTISDIPDYPNSAWFVETKALSNSYTIQIACLLPSASNISTNIYYRTRSVTGSYIEWRKILNIDDIRNLIANSSTLPEIRILFVGNSLTQDGIAYLPYVLRTYYPQIKFKFYIWYNGGYNLSEHYNRFINDYKCSIFSVCENDSSWTNYNSSKTMSDILNTYQFDIVSLQEYEYSMPNYSETDLVHWNNCRDYIVNNYAGGNSLEFISLFHAPRRDSPDSRETNIVNMNKIILDKTISDDIIINGLAVYRALSTSLDALGDRGHLSPDGTHTQEGLPCLLQTWVSLLWLLDRLGLPKNIYGNPCRITTDIYNSINVPGANLGDGVITGTDSENLLAQEIAIQAYKEGKLMVAQIDPTRTYD